MAMQDFVKTLKTAKRSLPAVSCSLNNEHTSIDTLFNSALNTSSFTTPITHNTISSFLSSLSSNQLHTFISDPNVKTYDCLRIFNLVLHNQSQLSFKPDVHAHLTLTCRLINSRMFSDAEFLLEKLLIGPNHRYPFSDFARWVDNYCKESKIITKLLNLLLKLYSDHEMHEMVVATFDYLVQKDVKIHERACCVHLKALVKTDKVDLAFNFYQRMVGSGMYTSVFPLTLVVNGLCKTGELKVARELVEEMSEKGVKPNVITTYTLLDSCLKRWEFGELDRVLCLMEREDIQFNVATYELLIEGYSSSTKLDEAKRLLLEMQEEKGFKPKAYLYYVVIRGYCRLGDANNGFSLLRDMKVREIVPCDGTHQCLISCMCKLGEMGHVKELVNELLSMGGEVSDDMLNSIVNGYRKAGLIDHLEELKGMLRMNEWMNSK